MRDQNLHVGKRDCRTLEKNEIPGYAAKELSPEERWDPAVCLNSLDRFLTFIKSRLCDAPDLDYFRFSFDQETGLVKCSSGEMGYKFVENSFIDATRHLA